MTSWASDLIHITASKFLTLAHVNVFFELRVVGDSRKEQHLKFICCKLTKAMFTLYGIGKRSVAESVPDRASVHTRNFAFEAFSGPEQYCSAPLLKVERSVSDRFLKRSESSLSTLSEQKALVIDLFKSKESVANCMTEIVHTGNTSEQFLHRNRTLILVREQLLKQSKNLSGTV